MKIPGFGVYFDRHSRVWCWREQISSRFRGGELAQACGFKTRMDAEKSIREEIESRKCHASA